MQCTSLGPSPVILRQRQFDCPEKLVCSWGLRVNWPGCSVVLISHTQPFVPQSTLSLHLPAESALNEEAGKLLLENYADYEKHARLMTSIHAQPSKRYALPLMMLQCIASLSPLQT